MKKIATLLLVSCLGLLFAASTCFAQELNFASVVTYNTGLPASGLAVGDLNGDGKPDVVVTQGAENAVTVLLGNGDGTFQTAGTYPAGSSIIRVAMGDVNGDGNNDVIVANWTSPISTVSVLLGNGDGSLQPPVGYSSVASGANNVAIGDVNGDGKPDLVVSDYTKSDSTCAGAVTVLLGNGNGTFQPGVTYDSGGCDTYGGVAIGDVNGDGKPDVVVTSYLAIPVSITTE